MIDKLFLSVGAMKAGTTWLFNCLKEHPQIHFTPEKEVHYFANKVGIGGPKLSYENRQRKLQRKMQASSMTDVQAASERDVEIAWYANYAYPYSITNEWYESLFTPRNGQHVCADFSNLYCRMGTEGWTNVHRVANDIRVIYTLRDPLERLWSHYKFQMGWQGRRTEVLSSGFEHFKRVLSKPWFWANAEYARNLDLLRQSLQDSQIRVQYFEDIIDNPEREISSIQRFIGVDDISLSQAIQKARVNKQRSIPMPDEWQRYALQKLGPIMHQLDEADLWHTRWQSGEEPVNK